jgi:hypothetical protein
MEFTTLVNNSHNIILEYFNLNSSNHLNLLTFEARCFSFANFELNLNLIKLQKAFQRKRKENYIELVF